MKNCKKWIFFVMVLGMLPLLSGCFVKTVDELYALPRHSDEYEELQSAIDDIMVNGASYCAPISGTNQQSVQLSDLDGDGKDEAIVFLKTTGENPLCAYIFDYTEGKYQSIAVIEGNGTSFDSVEYVQLDDNPGNEILIGRKLSNDVLQTMSVYSLTEGHIVELMNANYSEYRLADLTGNSLRDIFVLRFDAEERTGVAELYCWKNGQIARETEASMSVGVESVKRIITGNLLTDVPAVFVASVYDNDSIVTDIFAYRAGTFQNVSASDGGISTQTLRNYFVYASDIDSDGLIELPKLVTLPSETGQEAFSIIEWYNLSLSGRQTVKLTTYHDFSGGWYLEIPDDWRDRLTISAGEDISGVHGLAFHQLSSDGTSSPIFTLYAFSGDDRAKTATDHHCFILAQKGDTAYCVKPGTAEFADELTQEAVQEMFHFIRIDWNSGET